MNYIKLIGGIVAMVIIIVVVRAVVVTVDKANMYDETVIELKRERAQNAANIDAIARDISGDAKDRATFARRFDSIDARFDSLKIPEPAALVQTTEIPGAPCPRVGVSADFVRVYNEAAAGVRPPEDKAH